MQRERSNCNRDLWHSHLSNTVIPETSKNSALYSAAVSDTAVIDKLLTDSRDLGLMKRGKGHLQGLR
jgi:hypothetical protein